MTDSKPQLRYLDEYGDVAVAAAVEISFYIRRSWTEIGAALFRALETFRQFIGPERLSHYYDTSEGAPDYARELNTQAWQAVREELLDQRPPSGYAFAMREERFNLASLYALCRCFQLEAPNVRIPTPYRVCWLHFRLPTEYLEEHGPERVRELSLALAEGLPFNSGFVNLSLFLNGDESMWQRREVLRWRYLGLHVHDDGPFMDIGTRVNGVHWLNFLGQPVLGQLGGAAGLRSLLPSPEVSLEELSGERVLIRLGERPQLGDVQAGESLPLHRALARVLEPYLYHENSYGPLAQSPYMLRWERRFLE